MRRTVLAEVRRQAAIEARRADAEPTQPELPGLEPVRQALVRLGFQVELLETKGAVQTLLTVIGRVNKAHKAQAERLFKSLGINPFENDKALAAIRDAFVRENAALIKSIPTEMAERIGKRVSEGVSAGKRWSTIATELAEEPGIGERRARLIARDQVSKFNGRLNESRQTGVGITHYRWRGAMDARERPKHVALQGRVFAWSDPPPTGHPGHDINCRCVAIPVVSARDKAKAETISPEQLEREAKALGPTIKQAGVSPAPAKAPPAEPKQAPLPLPERPKRRA